jgi:uracil-DNA glycosylase
LERSNQKATHGHPPGVDLAAWNALSEEIRSCERCPLHADRHHAVVYRGSLDPQLLFVGEAPGAAEDRIGLPFVGRAGQRLDAAIRTLGMPSESYGVLNVLKCRPPKNRFDPGAARTCRPYLDRQLDLLRPEVLVPLGASALRAFWPEAGPMLESAGRPMTRDGRLYFPMLHPAATLRSRRFHDRWEADLGRLREFLVERGGIALLP